MRSALLSTLLLATLLWGVDRPATPHLLSALDVASDSSLLGPVLRPPSPVLLSGGFGETGARAPQPAPHRVRSDRPRLVGTQVTDGQGAELWGAGPSGHRSPDLQPRPPPVSLRIA